MTNPGGKINALARVPSRVGFVAGVGTLMIEDYQTAIGLIRAIEEAAEEYLKEREERGE